MTPPADTLTEALAIVLDAVIYHGWTIDDPDGIIRYHSATAAAIIEVCRQHPGTGWPAATRRLKALHAAGHDIRPLYALDPPATPEDAIDAACAYITDRRRRIERRHQLLAELAALGDE